MHKAKILVVDDDPDIVETMKFSLDHEGYEVITSANGEDAMEKARKIQPDLIVLDVMMPGENGYRVARTIKEDIKAGKISKNIPIILLTARNLRSEPDREKIFLNFSQTDIVIYKPFEMDNLLKRIQELLKA